MTAALPITRFTRLIISQILAKLLSYSSLQKRKSCIEHKTRTHGRVFQASISSFYDGIAELLLQLRMRYIYY